MRASLNWAVRAWETAQGNSMGYGQTSQRLHDALMRLGVRDDPDSDVAVHYCYPGYGWKPTPDKRRNYLFTMFESPDPVHLSTLFAPYFAKCDGIIVPSEWCREIFRPWTDRPIAVCPLGIDVDLFPYKRRNWMPEYGQAFNLLYCGAPNQRKYTFLFKHLVPEFIAPLGGAIHLYVKTTGAPVNRALVKWGEFGFKPEIQKTKWGEIFRGPYCTVDNRKIPYYRLSPEVYEPAHGFVLLTAGEGWGQTALEAMASGLPLVVSDSTGLRDFISPENCFPVSTKLCDLPMEPEPGQTTKDTEGKRYRCYYPSDVEAVQQIGRMLTFYRSDATVRARRAAGDARRFTWDASARRLLAILDEWE